ncbi:MAG: DUF1684 domain-containing protein [Gammaproteobacteria bacterium]|nr:DUF1684 domain-containing protein [Gammaproteobacteria bacterium]
MTEIPDDAVALADWRRQVAEMYARVRWQAGEDPKRACEAFRSWRDALFKTHPQSPLSSVGVERFSAIEYFPYDPRWRLIGRLESSARGHTYSLDLEDDGLFRYTQIGVLRLEALTGEATLELYSLEGYGGGLFLPFLDGTNGDTTYGGGRYLLDTIKGADLGLDRDGFVLDFNFAYNPSCAYDAGWVCPLAPPQNGLPFEVLAGEKDFRPC